MILKTSLEENFIQLLADNCSKAIMSLTAGKEYSAQQLSRELNIPSTTVYRKLKLLEEANMIQNVKTLIDLRSILAPGRINAFRFGGYRIYRGCYCDRE